MSVHLIHIIGVTCSNTVMVELVCIEFQQSLQDSVGICKS
jgi:hypothetical protein